MEFGCLGGLYTGGDGGGDPLREAVGVARTYRPCVVEWACVWTAVLSATAVWSEPNEWVVPAGSSSGSTSTVQ